MKETIVYALIGDIWDRRYREYPQITCYGVYKDRLEAEGEFQKITDARYLQLKDKDWYDEERRENYRIQEVTLYE